MKNTPVRGFTLLETLIAVAILSLAIAGPLFTASRALVAAETARDQLISSYLAQEGVEYVRAMRDAAYLNSYKNGGTTVSATAWTDFISGSSAWSITTCISSSCTVDPFLTMGHSSGQSLVVVAGTASPLYLNAGLYRQQLTGTKTVFTRTVRATTISPSEEKITSTVSWSFHGTTYSVVSIDHLSPWQ